MAVKYYNPGSYQLGNARIQSSVNLEMFGVAFAHKKILLLIVMLDEVYMMNPFCIFKVSANGFFRDQSMFVNKSSPIRMRVILAFYLHMRSIRPGL